VSLMSLKSSRSINITPQGRFAATRTRKHLLDPVEKQRRDWADPSMSHGSAWNAARSYAHADSLSRGPDPYRGRRSTRSRAGSSRFRRATGRAHRELLNSPSPPTIANDLTVQPLCRLIDTDCAPTGHDPVSKDRAFNEVRPIGHRDRDVRVVYQRLIQDDGWISRYSEPSKNAARRPATVVGTTPPR